MGMIQRYTVGKWLPTIGLVAGLFLWLSPAEAQYPVMAASPYGAILPPKMSISTGLEFTDNYDQSETNRLWDLKWTITPSIADTFKLPFGNSELTLANSFTFKKSILGRDADTFDSPASANLGLSVMVADWQVSVKELLTFNNQPLESTLAIGEKKTSKYDNTAGIQLSRQMGKLGLTIGFQRFDTIAPQEPDTEETRYEFSLTPSYYFNPNLSLYWSHTFGLTYPKDPQRSRAVGYSTLIGLNGRITQTLSGSIGLGFAFTHLDPIINSTTNIPSKDLPGLNAMMALNYAHPLRPNTTHSLTLAYAPGVTALLQNSNAQESMAATYALLHRLGRGLTLSPSVNWTHLKDIGNGGSGENTHMVRLGVSLGGALTDELNVGLNYFYQTRMSNLPEETYDAHQINMNLSKRFTARLTGNLQYTFETRSGVEESYDEHSVTSGLTQRFSPHISGTLQYTYKLRDSKEAGDSYYENIIAATVTYTF